MKSRFARNIFLTLLFSLSFAIHAFGAIPEPMDNFYVNDYAGVISDEERDKIIELNKEIAESGAQIVVATVDFTDGMGSDRYATEMFNQWGIGDASKDNGVLILLVIGEDDYFISLGTGTEKFISSGDLGVMIAWHLEAYFAAGDYGSGAVDIAYAIGDKIKVQYSISDEPPQSNSSSASAASNSSYVIDNAGVISAKIIDEIGAINEKLYRETGGEVALYTVQSLDGKKISEEAGRIFDESAVSRNLSNSMLIFFAIDEDDYYILAGADIYDKMGRSELVNIMDNFTEPGFAIGDYDLAALETVYELRDIIIKYHDPALGFTSPSTTTNFNFTDSPPNNGFGGLPSIGGIYNRLMFSGLLGILRLIIVIWIIVKIFGPRRTTYIGGSYYPRRRWYYPWTWHRPRWNRPYYPPPRNNTPPPRNHSGGGFFGGSNSSGGGSGRNSGGSFGSSGGGRTSGGGAGRSSWSSSSSGGSRSSSSSGRSSSGGSRSSGGGGRSSGGGSGRRK